MSAMTSQKARFFDLFGYLYFPRLFAGEAEAITQAFEAVWLEHGGGHNQRPHDDKRNSALLPFIDRHPYLCALLDDERVESIGATLLGADFNYMSVTATISPATRPGIRTATGVLRATARSNWLSISMK